MVSDREINKGLANVLELQEKVAALESAVAELRGRLPVAEIGAECLECKGEGAIPTDGHMIRCGDCNGTGTVTQTMPAAPKPEKAPRHHCSECEESVATLAAIAAQEAASTEVPATKWRVGRNLGRTVYQGDTLVGLMDTLDLAAAVVAAMNQEPPKCEPAVAKVDARELAERVLVQFIGRPVLRVAWCDLSSTSKDDVRHDIAEVITRALETR